MRKLIIEIHTILNFIKGFEAGYSTSSNNQMMIDYKGKRYMVTFEELCDTDEEEMYETMKDYWRQQNDDTARDDCQINEQYRYD